MGEPARLRGPDAVLAVAGQRWERCGVCEPSAAPSRRPHKGRRSFHPGSSRGQAGAAEPIVHLCPPRSPWAERGSRLLALHCFPDVLAPRPAGLPLPRALTCPLPCVPGHVRIPVTQVGSCWLESLIHTPELCPRAPLLSVVLGPGALYGEPGPAARPGWRPPARAHPGLAFPPQLQKPRCSAGRLFLMVSFPRCSSTRPSSPFPRPRLLW